MLASHDLEVFDVEALTTHGGRYACSPSGRERGGPEREHRDAPCDRGARRRSLARSLRTGSLTKFTRSSAPSSSSCSRRSAPGIHRRVRRACEGKHPPQLRGRARRHHRLRGGQESAQAGHTLPGTRIPVHAPERLAKTRPDVILVLPWNLEAELKVELAFVRDWGGRLVVPIPTVRVVS